MPNYKIKDLSGQRFNKLLAIEPTEERANGGVVWKCLCDCGKFHYISSSNLQKAVSCGCFRSNIISPDRKSKICSRCGIEYPINGFGRNKSRKDGHSQYCKECIKKIDRYYLDRYREHRTKHAREYRQLNINTRIVSNLRRRINSAIKTNSKKRSTVNLIGCSIDDLKKHLETRFDSRMSWDNYGIYWHIDHIIPCANFDLSTRKQQELCFNYNNLQPLEAAKNRSKGSKIYCGEN